MECWRAPSLCLLLAGGRPFVWGITTTLWAHRAPCKRGRHTAPNRSIGHLDFWRQVCFYSLNCSLWKTMAGWKGCVRSGNEHEGILSTNNIHIFKIQMDMEQICVCKDLVEWWVWLRWCIGLELIRLWRNLNHASSNFVIHKMDYQGASPFTLLLLSSQSKFLTQSWTIIIIDLSCNPGFFANFVMKYFSHLLSFSLLAPSTPSQSIDISDGLR